MSKKDVKDVAKIAAGAYIGSKIANRQPKTFEESTFGQAQQSVELCDDMFGPQATLYIRYAAAAFLFIVLLSSGAGLVFSVIGAVVGLLFGPYVVVLSIGIGVIALIIWLCSLG